MFNVVSAKKRNEFVKDVDQMFDRLQMIYGDQATDQYDHDEVIYVLYSHKKFGVIGSARLIPAGCNAITKDYLCRLKWDAKNKIYELSRVAFHIPRDNKVTESDEMVDLIRRDFYQGLYESLKTISISQRVKTFISILSEEEHKAVQSYGLWPFEKQGKVILSQLGSKVCAFGVLPMSETLYKKFLHHRQSYETQLRQSYS